MPEIDKNFFITPDQAHKDLEAALERYGKDISQALEKIEKNPRPLTDLEEIFLTEKIGEIKEMLNKPYGLDNEKRSFLDNLLERIENLLKSSEEN